MGNLSIKDYMSKDAVRVKFAELLGEDKSKGFITSVMQVVTNNNLLAKSEPQSIYEAAAMAAVLDLPINNNLGLAYIVPYAGKAQFQLGYKGFIALAVRSGQYKTISSTPIYKGQLLENNPLTGFKFDFNVKPQGNPIGYASFFELHNGFSKTLYMSHQELDEHAKKYSKSYSRPDSIWKKDFSGMAQKTVLKLLISKYGPMSLQMEKAILSDQAIIKNHENNDFDYGDSPSPKNEAEKINEEFQQAEFVEEDEEELI